MSKACHHSSGVVWLNITLNSGRFLINLKPHAARTATASESIGDCKGSRERSWHLLLFMQPVQDLSVETASADAVSVHS